jgi:hypothetical protein
MPSGTTQKGGEPGQEDEDPQPPVSEAESSSAGHLGPPADALLIRSVLHGGGATRRADCDQQGRADEGQGVQEERGPQLRGRLG